MKYFFYIFLLSIQISSACQCPITKWSIDAVNKNDIIFIGKIKNIVLHQNNYTVVIFDIDHLYKGQAFWQVKILFPENDGCAIPLNLGEEWLIYAYQKQINTFLVEWCGFSRKKIINDNEDFFIATHLITYDEELHLIRKNFSEIKPQDIPNSFAKQRNIIPNKVQFFTYLLLSLMGLLIIYILIKKYLK